MFFLKKLFQIRDQSNLEGEKPFLAHLDDLRVTMFRIIATLLVATIVCYLFRNELMDLIRDPVEQVWTNTQENALQELDPRPSLVTWEKAVSVSNDSLGLNDEQRANLQKFAGSDDPDFPFYVEAAYHFRIALTIEEEEARQQYVKAIPDISDKLRKQLLVLVKGNPDASLDAHGRMVLMQSLNPTEGFMLSFKLAFFAGLVVSFPFVLYFLLQFILPGLHAKEQKALFPALAVGFALFLTGALFAYFVILPNVLDFFYNFSLEMGIENDWRIGYYISFATQFVLIFGLAFELPVVVMTLVKLGILSYEMMRTTRSYAILAIVVIAAIVTPTPDALTLGMLAGPMYLLYEICIWLAYFIDRKDRAREAQEEKERLAGIIRPQTSTALVSRDDEEDNFDEEYESDYPGPDPDAEDRHAQAPPEDDDEEESDKDVPPT
jgi:sec-independent protein translocase protein TatC